MKTKALIIVLFLLAITVVLPEAFAACITPTTNLTLTTDTTFCSGSYAVTNIAVKGDNIVIDCNGARFANWGGTLFNINGRTGVTLKNCQIEQYGVGVQVEKSSSINLQNINCPKSNNYCVILTNTSNSQISSSTLSGSFDSGLSLAGSNGNTISNNNLSNNQYRTGVYLSDSSNNVIKNNIISGNGYFGTWYFKSGIAIMGNSNGNTISDNKIQNNKNNGIYAVSSPTMFNTIINNTITNNSCLDKTQTANCNGIYIASNGGYKIQNNNITANARGIYFSSNNAQNKIEANNIYGNSEYNLYYSVRSTKFNAGLNWWGTVNETQNKKTVFDCVQNPTYTGCVNITPMLCKPYLNGVVEACVNNAPKCSKNSDCGVDGPITSKLSCGGPAVVQLSATFTCKNPGTASATCSNTTYNKLIQACNSKTCSNNTYFCKGNDAYFSYSCIYDSGCANGACTKSTQNKETKLQTCPNGCLNGTCKSAPSILYNVTKVTVGSNIENRFYYNGSHILTLIQTGGAISLRPHPGTDVNGWGSSLYLQPFLPGATLKNTVVNSIVADNNGIKVNVSGKVSQGASATYGTWKSTLYFNYDKANKKISGNGNYSITLANTLSSTTGDLNLLKIASNYLTNVPLLSGGSGDTGDMTQANVVGKNTFSWVPKTQPAYFPYDISDSLSIDVTGNYYNVNSAAQGYAQIAPAYKPSLKVVLQSKKAGTQMIFGGIYDTTKSTQYWADNVGITPLILKSSTDKQYDFTVQFESKALANG